MSGKQGLADLPVLVAGAGVAVILTQDGELLRVAPDAVAPRLGRERAILVHAPATFRRLGMRPLPSFDLLELFAFVAPATSAAPTPRGIALALGLSAPRGLEAAAALLPDLAADLLRRLSQARQVPANRDAAGLAARMGEMGWAWAPLVLAALAATDAAPSTEPFRVWRRLPEWEETAPLPPPSSLAVSAAEARIRLASMLGPSAEHRAGQADYADAASAAFAPRAQVGAPHLVLAEAGTGTGKTLGYIAPASLWAERNRGTVWISTYTRHLQRQIDSELARLIPDPDERRRRVVVRKGRENYLCLLNMEGAVASMGVAAIPLGLIARWAMATADGDLTGGDLPGWFGELFGVGAVSGLADRRGECIHGGCPHYRRCFVEQTIRRSRQAQLVVGNHALVMMQAAWAWRARGDGVAEDDVLPTRYVFDEGHHVFDAADSAFAAELSGVETAELRRWLLGAEGSRSRAKGLKVRLEDLVAGNPALEAPLDAVLQAARALPAPGWSFRLSESGPELTGLEAGRPNPTESLLGLLRAQILARVQDNADGRARGSVECDLFPLLGGVSEAALTLERAYGRLLAPLLTLAGRLAARLEDEADTLEETLRGRIEANVRSIRRRAIAPLDAWRAMLRALAQPPDEPGRRPDHVFFLSLSRREEGDRDVGLHRHWLDPTIPFASTLVIPAHGLLVTSATLRDGGDPDAEAAWAVAEARVGATHLPTPAVRTSVASPFDYARQTRAFVVSDVATGDLGALAGAYRALFLAAGGGGLGLFTAISRLRQVHARIAPTLEEAGIPLLAQHVDAMDNATLVDIFRTEEETCLLGTDAMRDGVDVPGRALRLVVFERVPWPRPDILHRERRVHLSGGDTTGYDDRISRLRLRQAFGRLIRAGGDRGVFVLLDRRAPTRLLSAFPPGVVVRRVGLAAAVAETAAFLAATG